MQQRLRERWFVTVSAILLAFGVLYVCVPVGLLVGRVHQTVGAAVSSTRPDVLLGWEGSLYGAIMVGWGLTLLLIGRVAFTKDARPLRRAVIAGLAAWLTLEAIASAWFGVWFNIGVDAAVLVLFAVPLLRRESGGPTSSP